MSAEVKWDAVIATVGVTRTNSGRLCTEEGLRNGEKWARENGEPFRYDEASKSLIQVGPYTEWRTSTGVLRRAVYTFPPSKETK